MAILQLQNSNRQCFVGNKDISYLRRWVWSLNGRYVSRGKDNKVIIINSPTPGNRSTYGTLITRQC